MSNEASLPKSPPLTVLSLFSGIGGLDLGLERAGMEIVAHSEINPYASKVLAKHWPSVPNLGDISTITAWPTVDVIAGGFPCQDVSVAGRGAGIHEGTRSGLWSEYVRAIREIRPRYVIVENVAALRSRGLDRVLADLASCGFDAEWDCIPAGAVGAPHVRDRIFVIAHARNDAAASRWTASTMANGSSSRPGAITGSSHEDEHRTGRKSITSLAVLLRLAHPGGGERNPEWSEWYMGFPVGWTDCEPSATP